MKRKAVKRGRALQAAKAMNADSALPRKRSVRTAVAGAVNGVQKTGLKVRKARRRIRHVKKIIDLIGRLL